VRLRGLVAALAGIWAVAAQASEVIPPPPSRYFNDYAGTASSLEAELTQYEKATSNQVVVAIFPRMESDSSVEDYTVRVAESWHVGQKGTNNGVVLFVFSQDHKVYIQVGYGLEGALPDATAKEIVADRIVPRFKAGDYDAGIVEGVHAILAATRGEYKGSGTTAGERRGEPVKVPYVLIFFIIFFIVSVIRRRGSMYSGGGRRGVGGFIPIIFPGGGGGFGGGGGGFGGGGGGFSGGGGSFGGGGAGGSW
jgi:uncharacterized protein